MPQPKLIPEGTYTLKTVRVEHRRTVIGGSAIHAVFEVSRGRHKGHRFTDEFIVNDPDPDIQRQGRERATAFVRSCGREPSPSLFDMPPESPPLN